MYVFISDICQQEAKTYAIEDKIQQLTQWVENSTYQEFIDLFEMFAHPYYVRKGIAYSYRLLVKMLEIVIDEQSHQIVVFFRIFHRGDKDYGTLFHKADQHGDFFYNQQNLDKVVIDYLKNRLNNQHHHYTQNNFAPISYPDSITYFLQAKTNLLQLQQCPTQYEYYQENPSWTYAIRPFLNKQQLVKTFEQLQIGLETGNTHLFAIDENELTFVPQPHLLLTASDDTNNDPFSRYFPADIVLEQNTWLNQQQQSFGFYLNTFQQQVCDKIFSDSQSFPLIINAPAQQGKTSLLAMLTAHYLLCSVYEENTTGLPCLLLCDETQKEQLRQEISQYIKYLVQNRQLQESKTKIELCCMDLPELLDYSLDNQAKSQFDKNYFVDMQVFTTLWKKAPFIKNNQITDISIDLAWFVIQQLIKGETALLGTGKLFSQTLDNYTALTQDVYQIIYQKIWLEWYKPLNETGYWDLQDLLIYIEKKGNIGLKYRAILVDDSQQYSKIALQILLKHNIWWQQSELFAQSPMIFMGNRYASVPTQLFDWQDELAHLYNRCYQTQKPDEFLGIQQIDYQADFINDAHYALQTQRSKTNLIKFQSAITSHTQLVQTSLYFVNVADTQLIHALLLNKKIPLIINTYQKNSKNFIQQKSIIADWFSDIDSSQWTLQYHTLDNLPNKSYQISLLGFSYPEFDQFSESEQTFAFLPFNTRYQLDNQLNLVRKALQQGLKQVFIIGNDADFDLWQKLFCPILGKNCLQIPTVHDIYPQYIAETQVLEQQRFQALDSQNIQSIFDVALQYYQRFEYQEYFYLLFKICEISDDYQDYFDLSLSEHQKYITFVHLWQQKNLQIWFDYADSCPKKLQGNLWALQVIHEIPLKRPINQIFIKVVDTCMAQYQTDDWAEFWQIKLIPFLEKCLSSDDMDWSMMVRYLMDLSNHDIKIPNYILAMCYYRQGNMEKAVALWQVAEQIGEIGHLPKVYYQLLWQNAKDWKQSIMPLIQLKQWGILMNTLINNDLNELQQSYWDKILPYLDDEQELESVLLYLLPRIQNQEILEKIYQYCQYDSNEIMSDNFMTRLQRLKTLQACLSGDWDRVIERLQHYVPVQDADDMLSKLSQVFTTKKIMRGPTQSQTTFIRNKLPKPQDEVVDILYALNLNDDIYLTHDVDKFRQYSEQPHIQQIFDLIRQILSVNTNNDFDGIVWNSDFPAVRSLAYLLEKSDNMMDALGLYGNISHFSNNKNLKVFAIERTYLLLERAKQFLSATLSTETEMEENSQEDLDILNNTQLIIQYMEKEFGKLLKTVADTETVTELPVLKTTEDLVKSILALTDKEHKEIQRLEKEHRNFIKAQEAETKRLELQAKQQAEEQEKLEKAILAKAEKERQEKVRQEQQRLEQERLAKEREAKERLEQERLAKEREKQQHQEQPCLEQEKQSTLSVETEIDKAGMAELPTFAHQMIQQNVVDNSLNMAENIAQSWKTSHFKATSELQFFNWRVFVARLYGRINIEDSQTGERCSLYLKDGIIQSDWQYTCNEGYYYFTKLPLVIVLHGQQVTLHHQEHGVDLLISC